jgi:DNA-directed RNA polymerase specialized sigma24 family protein
MSRDPRGSVTNWIGDLKGGDHRAAHRLWDLYFHRLVGLARVRLGQVLRTAADADEEDVALSAFHSLCNGAARGHFERLGNRDDLWRLLVVITARKAADQKRLWKRMKRGDGKVIHASTLDAEGRSVAAASLEQVAVAEPTPDFAAELAEEYHRRLDRLGDETLRRVAELRLEGFDYDEIAERLGCARRTVARKLEGIRAAWEKEARE